MKNSKCEIVQSRFIKFRYYVLHSIGLTTASGIERKKRKTCTAFHSFWQYFFVFYPPACSATVSVQADVDPSGSWLFHIPEICISVIYLVSPLLL